MMMFRSRNEWFGHELQNHRREWVCQYCEHAPFPTAAIFSKHISASHPAVLANTQIEAILLQSEEAVDTISAFACPLCDEWEESIKTRQEKQEDKIRMLNDGEMVEAYGTRKQFRRHLGRHMEQLALFALPPNDNEMDNDSTDEDEGEDDDLDHDGGVDETQDPLDKQYDHVSYIFIPGRKGQFKVRYNNSEDVYDVAPRFIAEHKLPISDLEEITKHLQVQMFAAQRQPVEVLPQTIYNDKLWYRSDLFRPEQMRALPEPFTVEEISKWEIKLRQLWKQLAQNDPPTELHKEAMRNLLEFSTTLSAKLLALKPNQNPKLRVRYIYIWQCVSDAQHSLHSSKPNERPNSVVAYAHGSISWPLRVQNAVFPGARRVK
jgi:hypothetical protein